MRISKIMAILALVCVFAEPAFADQIGSTPTFGVVYPSSAPTLAPNATGAIAITPKHEVVTAPQVLSALAALPEPYNYGFSKTPQNNSFVGVGGYDGLNFDSWAVSSGGVGATRNCNSTGSFCQYDDTVYTYAAGTTAGSVFKGNPGRLVRIVVTSTQATSGVVTFYDSNTTATCTTPGTTTVIAMISGTTSEPLAINGYDKTIDMPFKYGLVPCGSTGSPGISVDFL